MVSLEREIKWVSPMKIQAYKCCFGVICNFCFSKNIVFQQLQSGLPNELDSFSLELKVFGSAF